jgi:hypothetical protein
METQHQCSVSLRTSDRENEYLENARFFQIVLIKQLLNAFFCDHFNSLKYQKIMTLIILFLNFNMINKQHHY